MKVTLASLGVLLLCQQYLSVKAAAASCSADATYGTEPICTSWVLGALACSEFSQTSTIAVDVVDAVIDGDYIKITSSGIPSYEHEMTAEEISTLNSRPNAATDFDSGATTAVAGQVYSFGADIGFTGTQGCASEGIGWWPNGPECPSDQEHEVFLPLNPEPATETCFTTIGSIGIMINGVSIFNWGDTFATDGWYNLAPEWEVYDVDVCGGHAAGGEYHHHSSSACLFEVAGDNGTDKSSIIGYAADGYPLVGPYVSNGVKAQSCWKKRDYSSVSGIGACAVANERTCQMVDQYDPSLGTTTTGVTQGLDTTDTGTSLSGNPIPAVSGVFFEDYYYDPNCTNQGDEYLDEHNGRVDSELGYVYHVTDGFPYMIGPSFYGKLHDNGIVGTCQTEYVTAGNTGPGDGGGPPRLLREEKIQQRHLETTCSDTGDDNTNDDTEDDNTDDSSNTGGDNTDTEDNDTDTEDDDPDTEDDDMDIEDDSSGISAWVKSEIGIAVFSASGFAVAAVAAAQLMKKRRKSQTVTDIDVKTVEAFIVKDPEPRL
eukprot:CAMPEP_0184012272 /NCGR_PEP_ID=MMETSP0954-20121128/4308_1 /TAXON_ID=627963 /ORGANISM="Aplanochytrium sp, Strain PBS07" /LENGTH=542 /DNA_ID=CAMNT_0026292217 /DNA_START=172 /DNA_END=1800 /DNA_ORIENTATION=-